MGNISQSTSQGSQSTATSKVDTLLDSFDQVHAKFLLCSLLANIVVIVAMNIIITNTLSLHWINNMDFYC